MTSDKERFDRIRKSTYEALKDLKDSIEKWKKSAEENQKYDFNLTENKPKNRKKN